MYRLGIIAAYRDSAVCLVRDGLVAAAADEERCDRRTPRRRSASFGIEELPSFDALTIGRFSWEKRP